MYSRQSNKPRYLRENHSPEGASLDTLRLKRGEGKSHNRLWWQLVVTNTHPSLPAPCQGLCHGAADSTDPSLGVGAAGRGCGRMLVLRVLSVPPGWNCHSCWWLSRAPRPADPSLPPSHPFFDLIWDLCTGKEGIWEAFFQSLTWLTGCVAAGKPKATPGSLGMGGADSQ